MMSEFDTRNRALHFYGTLSNDAYRLPLDFSNSSTNRTPLRSCGAVSYQAAGIPVSRRLF